MDELLDSAPFFLTGNTDTVYLGGFLDLKQDGPTVVEIPPGSGPGTVNDAWFRFRTRITQRTREQLDPDSSWEGLVHGHPDLRPTRTLVRPDMEARRHRTDAPPGLVRTGRQADRLRQVGAVVSSQPDRR